VSRISDTFLALKGSGRGGFIPFITAGDPDLATTELLLIELGAAGADIIELGVPFSDPVADGEVIQRASERALRNGVTLRDALTCIARAKQHIDVPIVLFSYFNPLLQFGEDRLAIEAKEAGVDAVLVTDLIPEEAQLWTDTLHQHHLDPIFLVAPTTSDQRLARIAQQARGFIYAISRAGVTGPRSEMTHEAEALVQRVRSGGVWRLDPGTGARSLAFCRCRGGRQCNREPNRETGQVAGLGESHRRVRTIIARAKAIDNRKKRH